MRYELTDYEWHTIKPFLPNKPRVGTSADAGNHSTKLHRRWFGAPTVVLRENRRSSSLMTVRRFTAQCLPPVRNKRNSTGDCHAAEFQTGRCRRWVIRIGPKQEVLWPTGKSVATALNSGRLAPVAVLSVEHCTVARRI